MRRSKKFQTCCKDRRRRLLPAMRHLAAQSVANLIAILIRLRTFCRPRNGGGAVLREIQCRKDGGCRGFGRTGEIAG